MSPIRYELGADRVVTLTFDAPEGSVNTMSAAWKAAFTENITRLEKEKETFDGVILASAKKTFFAGAELKDLVKLTAADAPRMFEGIEAVKADFRRLEKLGKPVVAAIAGTALGGGFEIALAAHCRICVDDAKIQLGFPEVTLGLIPGAGGITKMTRLLGLQAAFPYLIEGKLFKPAEAAKLGLLQGLAKDPANALSMAREWIKANPSPVQPWDAKDYRMPGGSPSSPAISQMLAVAPAMLTEKTRGLYPAPEAILSAMVEGAYVDFDTAMRIESRYLAKIAVGQVAKNMVSAFFFNLNAIKSGAGRPKSASSDIPRWKPAKVGILGAGMMGGGIAFATATRGIPCVLKDVTIEAAEKGKAYTETILTKRKRPLDALGLITPTANVDDLAGCDLIIEAVFEKRDLKAQVTKESEPKLVLGGVFASNTSTLPITGLALACAKPENFIGLHFFSPVDRMPLVEIIKGAKTSPETVARAYDYVLAIGKTPIVVNDSRGFYTSRTFGTFVMEGCSMLSEGIPPAIVEAAGRLAGMPVGPLEVIDQTSMSLSLHVMEQTKADMEAEGKTYVSPPGQEVVMRMVKEFKRPGRAAGGGFYEYPKEGRKFLWPALAKTFAKPGVTYDFEELKERILYRQAIETARCLEENVLTNVGDGNIGSIFGIGFPAWTGGALQYVNNIGAAKFVARADELAAKLGERFSPPKLLRDIAAKNGMLI